jgi:hypothetical protein
MWDAREDSSTRLVRKSEGKDNLEDLGIDERII